MHCDAAWRVLRGSHSLDCQPDDCHGHAAHSMHWPQRRQKCFQRNCQTAHGREVWNEGPHSAVCSAQRVSRGSCSLECRPRRLWVGGLLGVLCPLNRSLSCISRSSRAIVRIQWNADRSVESEEEARATARPLEQWTIKGDTLWPGSARFFPPGDCLQPRMRTSCSAFGQRTNNGV